MTGRNQHRVLFTATLVRGHIAKFHIPYLKMFKEAGWETWVAAKNDCLDGTCEIPHCDHFVDIPFARMPYAPSNLQAYRGLKKLIRSTKFDLIHTHTPVGSVLTRLAAQEARKSGTKLIYTAHGFHFYEGSGRLSWLLWYPIEKKLSQYQDMLITINEEDYAMAKQFSQSPVCHVHGVGVDTSRFENNVDKPNKYEVFGIDENEAALLAVGDLNSNKNHKVLIEALSSLPETFHLFIAGEGELASVLQQTAESFGVQNRTQLLGFRDDVDRLLNACDVFCLPSFREGLSVALIEAMASGALCLSSAGRGSNELLANTPICLVEQKTAKAWEHAIRKMLSLAPEDARELTETCKRQITSYSLQATLREHKAIYERVLGMKLGQE